MFFYVIFFNTLFFDLLNTNFTFPDVKMSGYQDVLNQDFFKMKRLIGLYLNHKNLIRLGV